MLITILCVCLIMSVLVTWADHDAFCTHMELAAMLARRMWWIEDAAETSPPFTPPPAQSLVLRIRSWARFRAL